ncbi:hypothetical protein [Bradyrhizobium centrosematis]|uniref:hypothetical protein n=1 Tax=Bradyrhizobium centrosematis TaxID=1300039 RepID=UPI002169A63F|nr:hypothetical protein [Bradyrhizobium centrosematis]MCS3765063.1 hypothetical protein [Bradyrhizobium centrosematis]MCS3777661.1 hypothetical protein [Bradyrhizobium centrosematis]
MISTEFAGLLALSILLAGTIVVWGFSWFLRTPKGRYWPLDIHFLNSAFFLLLDLQFLFASQYSSFQIGEQTINCSADNLLVLQFGNLIIFCAYAGLLEMFRSRRVVGAANRASSYDRPASVLLFVIISAPICGFLLWSILTLGFGGVFELIGARQYRNDLVFVILNASPFALVASLFVIFKSRSLALSIAAVIIAAGIAILSGGRGNIVSAFLLFVCAYLANGRPLNPYKTFVFGIVPLILLLQAYTIYVRYAGFQKVERGAEIWFGQVVESETFAIWKSVYAVREIGFTLPYPLYSLSAAAFFPVPRAIANFKPEPPSTLFTKVISPVRFENTGSEITLSSLGNLMAEFGSYIGGLVFAVYLAAISALQYRLSMNRERQVQAFILYFYTFSLWRSDLFTSSRVLWTFIILSLLFIGVRLVLGLLQPAQSQRAIVQKVHPPRL